MSCIRSLCYNIGLKCKYICRDFINNKNDLAQWVYAKTTRRNGLKQKEKSWVFLRHCLAWFRKLGHFYWPAAKPLADARGTLGFRGTLVENHCTTVYRNSTWAMWLAVWCKLPTSHKLCIMSGCANIVAIIWYAVVVLRRDCWKL